MSHGAASIIFRIAIICLAFARLWIIMWVRGDLAVAKEFFDVVDSNLQRICICIDNQSMLSLSSYKSNLI